MDNIELNIPFWIRKGNRKARWKIIRHPNFDNQYALVRDHIYLAENNFMKMDEKCICGGGSTLKKTWESAYDHT